jgi:hypothetical protein
VLIQTVRAQNITKLATASREVELQQLRHDALTNSALGSLFSPIIAHKYCSPGPADMQRMPNT